MSTWKGVVGPKTLFDIAVGMLYHRLESSDLLEGIGAKVTVGRAF